MTKRFYFIIIGILVTALAQAQTGAEKWKIHSVFDQNITNIIDTDSKVYYLVNENLFCYDKDNDENQSYTRMNSLTDVAVKQVYYNYDSKYLVVIYTNSNIDIIPDNGKTINIPDIMNADLMTSKAINDVTFNGNSIYVSTDFGFLILNDKKYEVAESHIFNTLIKSVAKIGNNIWLSTNDNLYYSSTDNNNYSLSSFTPINVDGGFIYPVDDNTFLYKTGWFSRVVINPDNSVSVNSVLESGVDIVQPTSGGFLVLTHNEPKSILYLDEKGDPNSTVELPQDISTSLVSSNDSDRSLWELNEKGIRHIKIENGNMTVLSDYFKTNSSSVKIPAILNYNTSQSKLYVTNSGPTLFFDAYGNIGHINTLSGDSWVDMTPESVTTIGSEATGKLKDPYSMVFDPGDADSYIVGSWFEGAYKITNGKQVAKYDWTNSPFKLDWYCNIAGVQFDKNNNLWLVQTVDSIKSPIIAVLPRAKQSQTELSASDWITPNVSLPVKTNFMMHFLITKKSNIKIITNGSFDSKLQFIDDGGDPSSSSLKSAVYSPNELYDQDEKSYDWEYIYCFTEDNNGRVWMGTSNGVVEFNPANGVNSNFRINHIKVPRNDGTNYADYLLSDISVTAIAIDGANRKWLGTQSDGIYLVNSDGTEILKHFNTENSYLVNNHILSINCNPNSNSVYIGTPSGLMEYFSDAAPASDDYSTVYAYPNPVSPTYSGDITISGLMDNSLVKIADAAGNVIKSLQSVGGMVSWDGCNANGERVKTGVYYVLASQNENSKSSGVVTKILFIK